MGEGGGCTGLSAGGGGGGGGGKRGGGGGKGAPRGDWSPQDPLVGRGTKMGRRPVGERGRAGGAPGV